ncbi:MAG: DUF222 domain-containing protein [Acidimicrobiia bacterium]
MCEDELMVPAHAAAICDALALRDRLDAAIAVAIGEFDRDGGWLLDGARSLKAWLIAHGRRSARDAARLVRDARSLRQLPVTAASYSTGQLSSGQVDAIVSRLSPDTVEFSSRR